MKEEFKADWFYQCPKCKGDLKLVRLDIPVHFMELVAMFLGFLGGLITNQLLKIV